MRPISVVIPVGPKPHHREWLEEALISVHEQSELPDELILINDGGPPVHGYTPVTAALMMQGVTVVVHDNPCNLGVTASLNTGVAIASNDLILLGCADDRFLPNCVQLCWRAWERYCYPLAYYYLGVKYSTGEEQNVACGAAMVTKALWGYTGGFPPQCAVGAADHIFLSALIAGSRDGYSAAKILQVDRELTYWYRQHEGTETRRNIWPAIDAVRDWFTVNWRPNADFADQDN